MRQFSGSYVMNKGIISALGYCSCGGHPMPSGSPTIGTYHIHCSQCAKITGKEFLVSKAIHQWIEIKD